jgi:hypothetical protein
MITENIPISLPSARIDPRSEFSYPRLDTFDSRRDSYVFVTPVWIKLTRNCEDAAVVRFFA